MERRGEKSMGEDGRSIWGMSIPDTILFPETEVLQVQQSTSKMSTALFPDPDREGVQGVQLQSTDSGRNCVEQHTHTAGEDFGAGFVDIAQEPSHGVPVRKAVATGLGTGFKMDEHERIRCLTIPVPNNSVQGAAHHASLQELLIGLSTGALCLFSNQGGHELRRLSYAPNNNCAAERNVELCNATSLARYKEVRSQAEYENTTDDTEDELSSGQSSFASPDVQKEPAEKNLVEKQSSDGSSFQGFDGDNEQTDNEMDKEAQSASTEADTDETDDEHVTPKPSDSCNGEEAEDTRRFIPTQEDLDSVDWERLYSTGELVQKNGTCSNDVPLGKENENVQEIVPEVNGTWKKRRRDKVVREMKQFRPPRGMGAVERAMRKFSENKKGHIFEPPVGLEFDSEAEAYEFYNLYSWEVGFGIRYGNKDGNKNGFTTMRDIVCLKQGYDKCAKSITQRSHCKAMIRLHRTDDDGWFISTFIKDHNHELAETDQEKREWKSHRGISQPVRDMIKNLRDHNIQLSRVHCIMGSLYGSMDNIPFTRRSLKIICAQLAREQRDDDIKKTLELFRQMRSEDPGFQFSVEVDEYNQRKTLIWATGRSRSNYSCFGDVVTFDTAYCTNIYNMPFGLFVGVNNHFQTTIFGGVLMTDETAESFKWVFTEFLALMGGVHPQTILTDQCRAMEIALKVVMPGTTHLWCRWHVFRDARIELGADLFRKNNSFRDEFHRVITEMYTVDEFEHAWSSLLEKYKLQTHHYMVRAYDKRHKWAKCYNSGTFCARMTSTQRSESANHMLKTWVPRNSSMNKFVSDLNKLLYQMYAEEERAEHETKQHVRVNKILWDVEKHAMKIYSKKVFAMFSAEMEKTRRYGVPETNDDEVFIVRHTNAEFVQRYRRAEFRVVSVNKGEKYECVCGLYEHFGILCCHILRVFIHTGVSEIPEAHIQMRWTRKARDLIAENLRVKCVGSSEEHAKLYIQSKIHGKALEVARKAKFDFQALDIVMKYLQEAERKVDEYILSRDDQPEEAFVGNSNSEDHDMANYTSSDNESLSANRFGASGSCAGMSDDELMNIKAPPRPKKKGPPRTKRFLSVLDYVEKKMSRKIQNSVPKAVTKVNNKAKKDNVSSTKITPHCTRCRMPGHNRTRCPNNAPAPAEIEELSD